ncbi:MAG: DNA-processing protein DprA [Micrococcales bacterium]
MNLEIDAIRKSLTGLVSLKTFDSDQAVADAFARVALSIISEPGDRFAGWLATRYRPSAIIEMFLNGFKFDEFLSADAQTELEVKFGRLDALFLDAVERWLPRLSLSAVNQSLSTARQLEGRIIFRDEQFWPQGLNDLQEGAPHVLWLRGNPKVLALSDRSISVVGSRLASTYGEAATTSLVSAAVAEQLAVISGGAYGIDSIAHRATIALDGFTVAVLAGGIDRMYPAGNFDLLSRIAKTNVIVSEQPPGSSPTKWRFLQRNRLIAALGSATVVVEAGARSGALNTATHAEKLGREIGAFPGRFDSPQSAGCHDLIRSGKAVLIGNPSHAIELVLGASESGHAAGEAKSEIGALETRALDALTSKAAPASKIAAKAGLTAMEVMIALGSLELLGFAVRRGSGWVRVGKVGPAN